MTLAQRGDLILLAHEAHWRVVEEWKNKRFEELKNSGLADDRSKWQISIDDKGEVVIFNSCAIPAEIFRIFNSEFFSEFNGGFNANWEEVVHLIPENEWERYTHSPEPNGKPNFKCVGWRMKGSIFMKSEISREDDEGTPFSRKTVASDVTPTEKPDTSSSDSEPKKPAFLRKIMD